MPRFRWSPVPPNGWQRRQRPDRPVTGPSGVKLLTCSSHGRLAAPRVEPSLVDRSRERQLRRQAVHESHEQGRDPPYPHRRFTRVACGQRNATPRRPLAAIRAPSDHNRRGPGGDAFAAPIRHESAIERGSCGDPGRRVPGHRSAQSMSGRIRIGGIVARSRSQVTGFTASSERSPKLLRSRSCVPESWLGGRLMPAAGERADCRL